METKAKSHLGRKISHIREICGIKQDALAFELGISQQSVSKIEQSEAVEDVTLERIAKIFGVPSDAIKNFSEEAILNFVRGIAVPATGLSYPSSFNFLDKIVELYERLLQSEREKVEILTRRYDSTLHEPDMYLTYYKQQGVYN